MSYLDRLNFQNELLEQKINSDYVVLYNSSAKDANACILELNKLSKEFIVEHKTYWFATNEINEAYYICSFLNSGITNFIIKDFQSRGLFGARDVHKKILEVPLPNYSNTEPEHVKLAVLGEECKRKSEQYLNNYLKSTSKPNLGILRSKIKNHLVEELEKIDNILKQIIGI